MNLAAPPGARLPLVARLAASLLRPGRPKLALALALSQALALWWWFWAGMLRAAGLVPAWYDQSITFTQVLAHWRDPYQLPSFTNPPWAVLLLIPFNFAPLPAAVLAQVCLYFALLTLIIFQRRQRLRVVLLVLTTFTAFDATLQLNIDWMVCLGLLVPAAWSGPFLAVKPQVALGYWFGLAPRTVIKAVMVTAVVGGLAWLVWGPWPLGILASVIRNRHLTQVGNLAPLRLLPAPLALATGIWLAWRAHRQRDPHLGVLAGVFFVPYLQPYSLLIHLALLAARWPRLILLVSVTMWVIYGGVLAWGFHLLGRGAG